jgi:uncharacterized protein YuzE
MKSIVASVIERYYIKKEFGEYTIEISDGQETIAFINFGRHVVIKYSISGNYVGIECQGANIASTKKKEIGMSLRKKIERKIKKDILEQKFGI